MPFLEVLTRCYKRPRSLRRNRASLDRQTCDDWVQTFLIDDVGRGVPWANRMLGRYADRLEGDYIWVLDDDDECICPNMVAELRALAQVHAPDVIYVRAEMGHYGVMPPDAYWQHAPVLNKIGMSNFVVRREVYQAHADAWPYQIAGDYAFISAVHAATPPDRVLWWYRTVMRCQRISKGTPE